MTDIFLSYTEKDREQARRVAAMLESVGWTVWWDRRIPAGETWRSVLEKALENMRCMIVLWSARSIESEWVYEEATEGRRLGKLLPVMIEAVRPPAGFREIQAADLTNWDGSREFEGMRMLLIDLENFLGKPVPAATGSPVKTIYSDAGGTERRANSDQAYDLADLTGDVTPIPWWRKRQLAAMAAAGALLLAAAAAYLALSSREPAVISPQVHESGQPEIRQIPLPKEPTLPPPVTVTKTPPPLEPTAPPVLLETMLPPVTKFPPRARESTKRDQATRPTSPRCANLLTRILLGETLSDEAQTTFQKECQQ